MLKNLKLIVVFGPLFIFFAQKTTAQSPQATIRGTIRHAANQIPLEGATIYLFPKDTFTISDRAGKFQFENLPIDQYQIKVSFIGFDTLYIPEVSTKAGKTSVLDLYLRPGTTQLGAVIVRGSSLPLLEPLSSHVLSIEETLRFPATFFDPARLATSFAGVANINDQANALSVRGNSPNGLAWRLEGLDIVNPNHTPNAGTFGDRIAQSSGGVNMLSAQMLDNSILYKGQMRPGAGNALAGMMDMHLRPGNDQKQEYTLQAGLIGVDAAAEGPLDKKQGSSYLLNYRYSTIGLLSALGLELGDEAISFQDVAFHLNFPLKNKGRMTVFGMGGISENIFEAQRDSSLWEFDKDRFDISFYSKMGALGSTGTWPIGQNGLLKTGLSVSALQSERTAARLNENLQTFPLEQDLQEQQLLSAFIEQNWSAPQFGTFTIGLRSNVQRYRIFSFDKDRLNALGRDAFLLFQPYLNWDRPLTDKIDLESGIHLTYFSWAGEWVWEPRMQFRWTPRQGHRLTLGYGLYSQTQLPQLYFAVNSPVSLQSLNTSKAHHTDFSYAWNIRSGLKMEVNLYHQYLFDIPVHAEADNSFSAINLVDGFVDFPLINEGIARNMGIEWSLQRFFTDQHYFLISASWLDAQYQGSDGVWRSSRYDVGYTFSALYGKEWSWEARKNRFKKIGINLRVGLLGGFRATPIDLDASREFFRTVFRENEAFSLQQDPFSRIDLRFYYTINKKGRTSTLSLDIQNAGNMENEAFQYYDLWQNQVVVKNQLGIIPILSYRVEF